MRMMNDTLYEHTDRPGFLLGFIDFFTAGLFFLVYMKSGLQDEIESVLDHKVVPYLKAYLLGIPTLFIYTLLWMAGISEELKGKAEKMNISCPHRNHQRKVNLHSAGWTF